MLSKHSLKSKHKDKERREGNDEQETVYKHNIM